LQTYKKVIAHTFEHGAATIDVPILVDYKTLAIIYCACIYNLIRVT